MVASPPPSSRFAEPVASKLHLHGRHAGAAGQEDTVTKRTYGILAGVLGSAIGAWWWNRQLAAQSRTLTPARERGTVIFDNTPTAAPEEVI
jgi:hypothetical protein